jgi:hypothetical protein
VGSDDLKWLDQAVAKIRFIQKTIMEADAENTAVQE